MYTKYGTLKIKQDWISVYIMDIYQRIISSYKYEWRSNHFIGFCYSAVELINYVIYCQIRIFSEYKS